MFNWFKKSRKEKEIGSLQDAEQLLHSASYKSAKPSSEFKGKLLERLLAARRHNQSTFMEKFGEIMNSLRWKTWVPVVSVALIILLVLPIVSPMFGQEKFLLIDRAYAQSAFEVIPEQADASGVLAGTPFKVKTKAVVDEAELKNHIRFEPEIKFDLKKISDTEYEVTPSSELEPATVYNLVIDAAYRDENAIVIPKEFRFAFQVKDTFKVRKTIPGDKKDNIPANTGIEVYFSHDNVTVADFEKNFAITPAAKGRFEKHGKALVFVPKDGLKSETLYTVKLAKGLPLSGTDQTLQEYSFQFFTSKIEKRAPDRPYIYFNSGENLRSFLPDESPVFNASVEKNLLHGSEEMKIKVYKTSSEEYLKRNDLFTGLPAWVCFYCYNNEIKTNGLPVVLETGWKDVETSNEGEPALKFPAFKDKGIYIVEVIDNVGVLKQAVFQVSDISAFFMTTESKSIAWVQNIKNKTAQKDAQVSIVGKDVSASTNEQGIATLGTPPCAFSEDYYSYQRAFVKVQSGADNILMSVDRSCGRTSFSRKNDFYGTSPQYWSLLTTDRPIYLPTDSIYFWGLAKKKSNGGGGEKLTLRLTSSDYSFDDKHPIAVTTVPSSELGTFNGKFDVHNVPPGYYTLTAFNGAGDTVGEKYFQVATFQKPLYQFEMSVDKKAVFIGEKVKVHGRVTFFDGTPVTNLELKGSSPTNGIELGTVKTNQNGEFNYFFDTTNIKGYSSEDYFAVSNWVQVSFSPVNAEYADIKGMTEVTVFNSDRELRFWNDYQSNKPVFDGTIQGIDPSKYNSSDYGKIYTGGVENQKVDITVSKKIENKIEDGETYDPITKLVTKHYRYESKYEVVKEFSVTSGAEGKFTVEYPFEKATEYKLKAQIIDSKGRKVFSTGHYWPRDNVSGGGDGKGGSRWIGLQDIRAEDNQPPVKYKVDDKVVLKITDGNKTFAGKGQFLYYTAQNGLQNYSISDKSQYEFSFEKRYVPNVMVGVVWFDGKYFQGTPISGTESMIYFDTDERKLSIDVRASKDKYRPGEEAVLDIQTKTPKGVPVSAEINVKLVDEAIYTIAEGWDNPIGSIYNYVSGGVLDSATTSQNPADDGPGGKGGGGDGENPRKTFKNTALFEVVKTGGDGRAQVKVKLPDDLTTFRATIQGVTDDLYTGVSTLGITTALPFFVDVTMNETYTTADNPQIRLRSFGTELKPDAEVTYTVSIPSLGENNKEIKVKSGEAYWYSLPTLKVGTHEMTIKAQSGTYKDAIIKKINVVDSLVTLPVSKTLKLTNETSLKDINAPRAKLVFSLNPYGKYYDQLSQLRWGWSNRLDAELASKIASSVLARSYGEAKGKDETNLTLYQDQDGGMQLLPYGSSDLDLSFVAAIYADPYMDKIRLESFFDKILEKQTANLDELCMALAGKAAMKLPVLNDIKMFLNHQKDLGSRERLILAYGLAALGDSAGANEILDYLLKNNRREEGDALMLDDLEMTALAGATAALASHVEAQNFFNAVTKYDTSRTLTSLEQVIMLEAFLKYLPPVQDGTLKYSVGERSETISLKKSQTESILVSQEELKTINFSGVSGPVTVTAYYEEPFASAGANLTKTLNVVRTYEVNGKTTTTLSEGQTVTVRLHPVLSAEKDKSGYEIIDTLPTGLLPMARLNYEYFYCGKGSGGCGLSASSVEGQRVSFHYYTGNKDITYIARVVSKGKFKAEPAVIQAVSNSTRLNISDSSVIEIK